MSEGHELPLLRIQERGILHASRPFSGHSKHFGTGVPSCQQLVDAIEEEAEGKRSLADGIHALRDIGTENTLMKILAVVQLCSTATWVSYFNGIEDRCSLLGKCDFLKQ